MACTPPRRDRAEWVAPKTLQTCYSFLRLQQLQLLPTKIVRRACQKSERARSKGLVPLGDLWSALQAKTSTLSAARILRRLSARHRPTALPPRDPTKPPPFDLVAAQPCRGERLVAMIARGVQENARGEFSVGLEGHTTCMIAFITGESFFGMGRRALECCFPVSSYAELQCTTRAQADGRLRISVCAVAVHAGWRTTPVASMQQLRLGPPALSPATASYKTVEPPLDLYSPEVPLNFHAVEAQSVRDMVTRMRRQVEVFSWSTAGSNIPTTTTPKLVTSRARLEAACEFYRSALARVKLVYELQALGGVHPLCHVMALDIAVRYLLLTVTVHPEGDADVTVSHYVPLCAFSLAMKYYGNGVNGRFALAPGWPQDCDHADSCLSVGEGGLLTGWLVRFYNQSCQAHRTPSDPARMTARGLTQREWLTFQVIDCRIHLTSLDLVQELVAMDQRLAATDVFAKASAFLQANLTASGLYAIDPALLGLCLARIYLWKVLDSAAEFVQGVMDAHFSSDEIAHCMHAVKMADDAA